MAGFLASLDLAQVLRGGTGQRGVTPARDCRWPGRRARPTCAAGSPPGNGWSTCAPGASSPRGTWPARSASSWVTRWHPSWAGSSRPGTPVTLLGETAGQVAEAQRELARIGASSQQAALATGKPEDWAAGEPLASFPVADFAGLAAAWRERPITVLDVRRDLEWAAGHLDGAVHIPLHELPGRLAEVPGDELWVHCAAGYRAAVAASLLQAAHRQVTAVDDEFAHAAEAGLPVVSEPAGHHQLTRAAARQRPVSPRTACCAPRLCPCRRSRARAPRARPRPRGPPGRCRCPRRTRLPRPGLRGHQDRDPRFVGHRHQGGDRRGQLGRPQVQPPAALVHHGGVAVGDPPPAGPADRALERHRQAAPGPYPGRSRHRPAR